VLKDVLQLSGLLALMAGGLIIAAIPTVTIFMLFFWLVG
jgi:hypothetical protein